MLLLLLALLLSTSLNLLLSEVQAYNISSNRDYYDNYKGSWPLKLTWIPNNEGLFANFLALRIMNYYIDKFGPRRLLVVPPRHPTGHFSGKREDAINLCNLFFLNASQFFCPVQSAVTAKTICNCKQISTGAQKRTICLNAESLSKYFSNPATKPQIKNSNLCYKDSYIPMIGMRIHREVTLAAVNMNNPPFRLNTEFSPLVAAFRESIYSLGKSNTTTNSFVSAKSDGDSGLSRTRLLTIVHWRRGDQLTSRCSPRQMKDVSVNCRNASDLHALLSSLSPISSSSPYSSSPSLSSPDSIIYIATNELQNSTQLKYFNPPSIVFSADIYIKMPSGIFDSTAIFSILMWWNIWFTSGKFRIL